MPIESSGSVFADLGFSPEDAKLLAMRAELMARVRETIGRKDGRKHRQRSAWELACLAYPIWSVENTVDTP
jgi:predicted XRE-type DNA-binding protein